MISFRASPDKEPSYVRVLHLLEWPGSGGVESVVLNLCGHQASRVAGVVFFRNGPGLSRFQALGVPILILEEILGHPNLVDVFYQFSVTADVVHLHSMYLLATETQVVAAFGKPYVCTLHSRARASTRVQMLTTLSPEIASRQDLAECIAVIQNGIRLSDYMVRRHTIEGIVRIIRVGRPGRTSHQFWDVLASLPVGLGYEVSIVGEIGPSVDGVSYLGFRQDVPQLLSVSDILLYTPAMNELGAHDMVILEAMAAGLAIVAFDVPSVRASVRHGYEGLLYQPSDITGMSLGLHQLITNQDLRSRLGENARLRVEQQFSLDVLTKAYDDVYLQTLTRFDVQYS